jgi:outer membrane protein assembly factor BamB
MRAAAFAAGIGLGLGVLTGGMVHAEDWTMYGHDLWHSSINWQSAIKSSNVWALQKVWTFWTGDAVSASPAVAGGVVYVGSWDGNFYALNAAWPYPPKWVFQVDCQNNSKVLPWPPRCGVSPPRQNTDGGLITSSAAVAVVDGIRSVFFAAGKTLYRLNADNGSLIWKRVICGNPVPGCDNPILHRDDDPTRIFSSPAVASGLVFIGHTVDGVAGYRGGFEAIDASTGVVRWRFELDPGGGNRGCGNVWSSAAVDTDPDRNLVFFGTSDCQENATPPYHEAVIALTTKGQLAWVFRPRKSDTCDFDFGASPNIINIGSGRFVGIGGKDGTYYLLRESDGVPVWTRRVVFGGAIGGFFGAAAFDGFHIFSSTAVGDPPRCSSDIRDLPVQEPSMHALNVWNGQALWERVLNQSFGATSVSNDAVFAGFIGASPLIGPAVKVYNAWSGSQLKVLSMPGQVNSAAVPVGRMLFVTSGNSTDGKGSAVHAFALPWWMP